METFHGYDFDTMTETVVPGAFATVPRALDRRNVEVDGDTSFMRGLMYGLLFTIPCWAVIVGTVLAVLS